VDGQSFESVPRTRTPLHRISDGRERTIMIEETALTEFEKAVERMNLELQQDVAFSQGLAKSKQLFHESVALLAEERDEFNHADLADVIRELGEIKKRRKNVNRRVKGITIPLSKETSILLRDVRKLMKLTETQIASFIHEEIKRLEKRSTNTSAKSGRGRI
jgi:hypothetical protein